jgi:hypothetical protein
VFARAHQDATWRRTNATNELRSLLREYHPGFLAAFAGGNATNLASSDARAVLAIAPTPASRGHADRRPHRRGAAGEGAAHAEPTSWPRGCAKHRATRIRARTDGGGGDGTPGPAPAGHPGHRVRQRRPTGPGHPRGVRPAPRLPDHHQLHRPRRYNRAPRVLAEIGDDRTRFADCPRSRPTPAPPPSPGRRGGACRSPTSE